MFDEEEYSAKSAAFQGVEPPAGPFPGVAHTDKLKAALQYAAAGLKIFPCRPSSKAPATDHGFKDASNVLRPLDHPKLVHLGWFDFISHDGGELTVTPRDNWAIEPGPAGFTVVDIDPKNGGDATWAALIAEHDPIATREVRTPSGGRHLWFSGTIEAVNKKLGPGIDTRCFRGYVLLPPSSIKGKRYQWVDENVPIAPLPQWAREIAEAQDEGAGSVESDAAFDEWHAAGGEGGRFEYLLSRIGDEASGGDGFADAMTAAVGYGARIGMTLDDTVAQITKTARAAPRGNRAPQYIEEKIRQLPRAFKRFRAKDAAREGEERRSSEEQTAGAEEEEVAEEPRPFPGDNGEWISPEAAIESLRPPIRAWLERDSSHEKTLTIVQSAAGLGKTQTMLEEQQRAEREDRRRAEQEDQSELAKVERSVSNLSERLRNEGDPAKQQPIERELGVQLNLWIEELLAENLAELPPLPLGKMGCAAPRHKLAQEIQEIDRKLRGADTTEEQIPILQGRNSSNASATSLWRKPKRKASSHRRVATGRCRPAKRSSALSMGSAARTRRSTSRTRAK